MTKKNYDYVGGEPRPHRIFTVGRRRQDRWVVRSAFAVFALMWLFVLWTSWQQNIAQNERDEIVRKLEQQNRDLLCLAVNTQTFEVAVGQYLLTQPNASDPEVQQQLTQIQADLRRAQEAQRSTGLPRGGSNVCYGPPADPPTGTTTTAIPGGTR